MPYIVAIHTAEANKANGYANLGLKPNENGKFKLYMLEQELTRPSMLIGHDAARNYQFELANKKRRSAITPEERNIAYVTAANNSLHGFLLIAEVKNKPSISENQPRITVEMSGAKSGEYKNLTLVEVELSPEETTVLEMIDATTSTGLINADAAGNKRVLLNCEHPMFKTLLTNTDTMIRDDMKIIVQIPQTPINKTGNVQHEMSAIEIEEFRKKTEGTMDIVFGEMPEIIYTSKAAIVQHGVYQERHNATQATHNAAAQQKPPNAPSGASAFFASFKTTMQQTFTKSKQPSTTAATDAAGATQQGNNPKVSNSAASIEPGFQTSMAQRK